MLSPPGTVSHPTVLTCLEQNKPPEMSLLLELREVVEVAEAEEEEDPMVEAEAGEGMVEEEEEDKDPLALCTPRTEERSTMELTSLTSPGASI